MLKKRLLEMMTLLVGIMLVFSFTSCDFLFGDDGSNSGGGGSTKVPTGVTATANSSSKITITWNAVIDATYSTYYYVYRSENSSGPYAKVGEVSGTNWGSVLSSLTYTNSSLSPATTFYYKVASNINNEQSSPVSATTFLVAPSGVNATSETSSSITINWNNLSGATDYRIYRSGSSSGTYTEVATSTSNSYTDTGLPAYVSYYYRVSGYNSLTEGDNSSSVSATTLLKAPTGVTATANSSNSITITWNAVTDATYSTYYYVYRSESSSGPYAKVGEVSGTNWGSVLSSLTYTNSSLSSGTTFYYKVAASNGEQSSVVSATTF